MKVRTQRILAMLLTLLLVAALVPTAWAVDLDAACTITVQPASADAAHEDGTTFIDDMQKANIVYDVYQVATAKEVPGYDTYDYELVDPFTGLDIKPETPTERNASFWEEFAQSAAKIVFGSGGKPAVNPVENLKGAAVGTAQTLPKTGLYLLIARSEALEWEKAEDYILERDKKTVSLAHSDRWNYYYAPALISVPTKAAITEGEGEDAESVIKTSNPGNWDYTPTVVLKPEPEPRNGNLIIKKTLNNYTDLSAKDGTDAYFEPATFSFSVVGVDKDGKTVYQREVSLSVSSPVQEKEVIKLDDIPVGTVVTVTETYSGAHYSATGSSSQTVTISTPQTTTESDGTKTVTADELTFTNEGNDTHRGGHGIENKFTFTDANGWQWSVDGEVPADNAEVKR